LKLATLYIFILVLTAHFSQAQLIPEKGVPHLNNYPPTHYQNKGKVWDIGTTPNGLVYMASDKGILEYDGKTWTSFEGSKGTTRSILTINDSLIYTGSDLDFGVWVKTELYNFKYQSLYPFKEEVQDEVEEFWNVHQSNDMIVFVSSRNIYLYKNEQVTQINAPLRISGSFIFNDTLYFSDDNNGLYYFDKLSFKKLITYPDNIGISIVGLYQQDSKTYMVTSSSGLYSVTNGSLRQVKNSLSNKLKDAKVFSFEHIGNSHLAFGTILKGLIITDLEGNVIHKISKIKGLLSNTILALHYSQSGKLWVGLDYGVSSLFLNNNITYFYDYRGDFGTGFVATRVNDEFYLGTNQGLYNTSWNALNGDNEYTNFELIAGTEGQVWSLHSYDDQLFIGHDHGLLSISNNRLTEINNKDGVWTILAFKDFLLTGTYNGISIYKKHNGKWFFYRKMDLISGSCNQLVFQNDNILWVNIPHFGVIKVELDNDLNPKNQKIFPINSFTGNDLYLVKNQDTVQIITDKKLYYYHPENDNFLVSKSKLNLSKPDNLLSGSYLSSLLCKEYEFFPVYNGFALKYLKEEYDLSANVYEPVFRGIKAYNNNAQQIIHRGSKVPYKLNNIRIEYILPDHENIYYQYKLKEEDKWSQWERNNFVYFVGMSAGSYNFQVRAKVINQISETISISFSISKPWYRTWQAYIAYFLLLAFIMYIIIVWQKRLLKREKLKILLNKEKLIREQEEKHQQEISLIEQERIKKEYRQLQQQLRNKTIELANKAKESEGVNRLLISIQEKFREMQEDPKRDKSKLSEIRLLLKSNIKVEDRAFEIQMDELHQEFFKNIKEQFPNLSINDLRLCAYIRVGLNSKEIANILNIQPSSSYIGRSRLRKKLNLKTEDDLYDFLNEF